MSKHLSTYHQISHKQFPATTAPPIQQEYKYIIKEFLLGLIAYKNFLLSNLEMARDDDIISLNSNASESEQSMQDWDYDDQVLDLDEKTLQRFGVKQDEESDAQEEEDDEEWGPRKNVFYDADQDSGNYCFIH